MSVYVSQWRTGFKVSIKYAIVMSHFQKTWLRAWPLCLSPVMGFDTSHVPFMCLTPPAAWPATGHGLREQRLQQLRLRRRHELIPRQHDHQWPAPEWSPDGTPKPRGRQNERSETIRQEVVASVCVVKFCSGSPGLVYLVLSWAGVPCKRGHIIPMTSLINL